MNSKRFFFVLLGVVVLLGFGLIAGTYGANKLLTAKGNSLTSLKAKSQALASEQTSLTQAKADITKYAYLDKIVQAVVPEDKNQAEAVREITAIAKTYGVNLASITFPASTLGTIGSSVSASSSSTTTKTSSATNALSQLTPVKNITGVYQLPITIQSDTNKPVSFAAFINFLAALEHNRRTAQVSSIAIQPQLDAYKNTVVSFILTLNEYIKP